MTQDPDTQDRGSGAAERISPLEAQRRNPEQATSELAPETPPQPDAERMERALREGGPLANDDRVEEQRRLADSDPGGTSLT